MTLLPHAMRARLVANFDSGVRDPDFDPIPVARLSNPAGRAVWLVTELFPDEDTLFGLADLGFGCPELGTFSLREIAGVRLPLGLRIACDLAFATRHRLSIWAAASRLAGSIPEAAEFLGSLATEDPAALRLLPRDI
ncbi:DUF2958 domain-containing protein [Novosphingobium kaempferiae]|uniref:DUF2958 domain-containing protein n=1 Tax=Novosphingobium kaempferiae TaxID=2896849 RepID=UPI001E655B9E|nr:DUF2958 domain-containing protein [Novosphingobium kaempferiae]